MNIKENLLNEMFSEFVDIIDGDDCRKNVYSIEWVSEYEFLIREHIHSQKKVFLVYFDKDKNNFTVYIRGNWTDKRIKKEYKTKKGVMNYIKKQIMW
jgi:hypothetical protein